MTNVTPEQVESYFEDAIKNEEFQVFYQPKVELNRYRLHGGEALCRWIHDGEFILPFQFIPVLEENGKICELDFYMIDHVCRDIVGWIDAGLDPVTVSVNLSRVHIGDEHLIEKIDEIVKKNKVPKKYLEIELTETTTDLDYKELKRIVGGLHEAGFRTSIDDFGVGYSSMNLLRDLPWDMIKIDRSFIPAGDGSPEDEDKIILLQSLIMLAHSLGIDCIAEGTETVDQIIILKQNRCFLAQGYFFDKPMPKDDFEARLKKHKSV